MNYYLMHKNHKVLELNIDEATAVILEIGSIDVIDRIPVGISCTDRKVNREDLNDWWQGRSIPASRQNLQRALDILGVTSPSKLLIQSLGLSLSDQYWINPIHNSLSWFEINFFEHSFSEDIGSAFFENVDSVSGTDKKQLLNLISPDNTSDGWLKKRWKIIDNRRYLIKAGSDPYHQQPINEMMASLLMKRLEVPYVEYKVIYEAQTPYSICENFIQKDTELVTAFYIHNTRRIKNVSDLYSHYVECCNELGIPDVKQQMNMMLTIDYLIGNYDRHMNNFGAIRDVNTLQWISCAPLYDNGSSFWCDTATSRINPETPVKSQPFLSTHIEQLRLVSDFDWLDQSMLIGLEDEFRDLLIHSHYIDEQRRDVLCYALKEKVQGFIRYINGGLHD